MGNIFTKKIIYSNFIALIFSTYLHAAVYYVSPGGNDNSSGLSPATAWQTISKVNSIVIQPGSSILFEGGQTFSGSIYMDVYDANDTANIVTISTYGSGKAIINSANAFGFKAYNTQGLTVSNLIFEGSGPNINTDDGLFIYTDFPGNVKLKNITIKNVEIHGYGKTGLAIGSLLNNSGFQNMLIDSVLVYQIRQNGIITYGYSAPSHVGWAHQNLLIKHTEVNNVIGYSDPTNHRGSGIILAQVDNAIVEKSCSHHNGSGNTHCGGPGGIWAYGCNNVTFQFCESHHNSSGAAGGCDGFGFDFDVGVTNSLIQYNYSHDNDGSGFLLGQYANAGLWTNNVVRYNISQNDGRTNQGGITLFKGVGSVMSGVKIYHNTIFVSPSAANGYLAALNFINWETGINNVEIYNNIFQTTGNVSFVKIPVGFSAYFAGNLYWPTGGIFKINYQGIIYNDLASWRAATGNEMSGANSTGIIADPLLANAGSGGNVFPMLTNQLNAYTLANNSPALDAGLDLSALFSINTGSHDFFNNSLPAGSSPDIGACEYLINTNLAANKLNSDKLYFYPNPSKSGERIHLKFADLPYSVELMTLTGERILKEEKINSESHFISAGNLEKGIYILSIIDHKGGRTFGKLLID